MKIIGCFKIVPDLDLIMEEDWEADDQLHVDTSYAKLTWNCFDESALELMLKLSDLSEGFPVVVECHALTIGKEKQEAYLRILYALKFQHTVRIAMEEEVSFAPEWVSELIASYIKNIGKQNVIVMGQESSDGSNGKTPMLTAERLHWPCFTQVIAIEPVDEQHLKLTRQTDAGILTQVAKTPMVIAVGNAPCSYLRVPTLKDKMRLGKQPIEKLTPEELGVFRMEESVELLALNRQNTERVPVRIEGNNPEEKARILYESYLKGRLKQL